MSLSSDQIKAAAIVVMLIDHTAACFLSQGTVLYFCLRLIGRAVIPIMCYFVAEGYHRTRDIKMYAARLFGVAIITHLPFYYFKTGIMPQTFSELLISLRSTSVMWTLFLGLIALAVQKSELGKLAKIPLLLTLIYLAAFGDWRYYAVIWILIFGICYGDRFRQFFYFSIVAWFYILMPPITALLSSKKFYPLSYFQIGLLLPIPILLMYNGQRSKSAVIKWGFYLFYPLHLLILSCIKLCIY